MKIIYPYITTLLFFLAFTRVNAQNTPNAHITGTVVDVETHEPLPGVNVNVKGTILGTITDSKGSFILKPKSYPVTLNFSLVGFRAQEVELLEPSSEDLPIELTAGEVLGQEVVVTASRVEESILKSPVAIEKLDSRSIKETP